MKTKLQLSLVVVVCLSALVFPVIGAEHTKDSLQTVKENVTEKKAVLVDVREKAEWDEGHIAGAVLLPLTELRKGIDAKSLEKKLPKDLIIYTHCVIGKRSLTAADILEKHGYEVRPLKAGYKELLGAGFETEEK